MEVFKSAKEALAFTNYYRDGYIGRAINFGSKERCSCPLYLHLILIFLIILLLFRVVYIQSFNAELYSSMHRFIAI